MLLTAHFADVAKVLNQTAKFLNLSIWIFTKAAGTCLLVINNNNSFKRGYFGRVELHDK